MALVIAAMMVVAMAVPAFAAGETPVTPNQSHTITIQNPEEQGTHTYEAYQVFVGDLDAAEGVLSNIDWGSGVDKTKIITELKKTTSFATIADTATAADIAKILDQKANDSDFAKDFAAAVGKALGTVAGTSQAYSGSDTTVAGYTGFGSPYTVSVSGDGYYFIKDKDATVTTEGESYTKFVLKVIKNETVVAKDTHTKSDKKVVDGSAKADDNNKAIGDTVNYEVTLNPTPDPTRFNSYKLEMSDTLEKGLTFTGITSVVLENTSLVAGTDYDLYINGTKTNDFTAPADAVNANAPGSATTIRIVFKNAKTLLGAHIGKTLTVKYTAVLNKDAELAPGSNDNDVSFKYSNNPNNTYEGDEITNDDVVGETPDKTVEIYTTAIEIVKTDGSAALEGATFEITGEAFNTTLVTGEVFVKVGDAYPEGSGKTGAVTAATATYWPLVDGTFTDKDPATVTNKTQYTDPDNAAEKYEKVAYTKVVKTPTSAKYTVVSGADGIIKLDGVKEGTYTIKETKAPDGYNLLMDTTTIVIDWDNVHTANSYTSPTDAQKQTAKGGFSIGDGTTQGVTLDGNGAKYSITIENNKGTELPSTGGMGTTIIYIVGIIIIAGAAVTLVVRRRANAQ